MTDENLSFVLTVPTATTANPAPVCWSSKQQAIVALSSEAKYISLARSAGGPATGAKGNGRFDPSPICLQVWIRLAYYKSSVCLHGT
jgi:hypothetical protein